MNGGGSSSNLYPKLRITMNSRVGDDFTTLPKSKTENPLFEQGWMLLSDNIWEDTIQVEVIDVKGIDTSLDKVTIPITFIADLPDQEFFDMQWPLEGGHSEAGMAVSAKLFCIDK